MSSRSSSKKLKPGPGKPAPAQPAPTTVPVGRDRRSAWIVGIVAGLLVGAIAGAVVHFSRGTHQELGTLNPAATPSPLPDEKQVYATYAGAASCRECHSTEYELWSKSH